MCIVCDIKPAVEASCPNKEDRAKILGLVEKLTVALGYVLEVAQEVHEAKPEAFQPEQVERLQKAAYLLNDRGELPDTLLAQLLAAPCRLAALLGRVLRGRVLRRLAALLPAAALRLLGRLLLGAASRSKQSASNCAKAKRQNRP